MERSSLNKYLSPYLISIEPINKMYVMTGVAQGTCKASV